jgi:antitoxin component YwqK of YwqJK toxin-antitoxin module
LKQGEWTEYRVLPNKIIEYGKIDSIEPGIVMLSDKLIFADECVVLMQVGNYENGLRNGLWKEYYPNGSLRHEITYLKGIPLGPFRNYYPNENLAVEGVFSKKPYISVDIYNEDGSLLRRDTVPIKEILEWVHSTKY